MSLVSDERRRILPDGSLFFSHVVHSKHNKPDEGAYQCVATIDNVGSISSRTARLSVAGKSCQIMENYFSDPFYSNRCLNLCWPVDVLISEGLCSVQTEADVQMFAGSKEAEARYKKM